MQDYTPTETDIEKFWAKVDRSGGDDQCWQWMAGLHARGYGRLRWGGEPENAHRIAWMLTNGAIPDGLHVLHTCDNLACCNPHHLVLGTQAEKAVNRPARKRAAGAVKPRTINHVLHSLKKLRATLQRTVTEIEMLEDSISQIK